MWVAVALVGGIYTALVGGIFAFQRHLMYHPVTLLAAPAVYNLPLMRDVRLQASDGITLQAWVQTARPGFPTLVYFHGNGGNLGNRASKFGSFVHAGFGLVAVSYRGFGASGGHPSEAGLYKDARAAIAYAKHQMQVPQDRLIYFGESLGTGVAIQMATEKAPALLVLEAAYTSVETRSAELYPFVLGVKTLVLDKYDSLSKIKDVHAPLLMLHGELDTLIPVAHGKALFDAANEPKELIIYPHVQHADYGNDQLLVPLLAAARRSGLMP